MSRGQSDFVGRNEAPQGEERSGTQRRTVSRDGMRYASVRGSMMGLVGRIAVVLAGLLAFSSPESQAQRVTILRGAPSCERCEIELQSSAPVGDRDGPASIAQLETRALMDSQGRIYLKGNYPSDILVLDRQGGFVARVGRAGGGPGEFRAVGAIDLLPGDSLFVFDWEARRYSLFGPDFEFVSSGSLPLSPEITALALPDGNFVFNSDVRTPDAIGQPLHLVSRNGSLVRSFGSAPRVPRPDVPFLMSRAIAKGARGTVWAAHRTDYRISQYGARNGEVLRTIVRDVDWFPPRMRPERPGAEVSIEPEPFVFALQEDGAGRLWTLVAVPDANWRRAVAPPRPGSPHGNVLDEQGFYDTVIEVIDPQSGQLLASKRIGPHLTQFVAPGIAGAIIEDEDGYPRLHLWTLGVVSPPE